MNNRRGRAVDRIIEDLCRNLLVWLDRTALSGGRAVESATGGRRLPVSTSGAHALTLSMSFQTIVRRSLTITVLISFLVVFSVVTTHDFHSGLRMLLSAAAILVAMTSLLVLVNTAISGYMIRKIKGEELYYAFEYADDATRKIMCDELERLYNASRMRLEKYEQIGLIDEPLFAYVLPKFRETVDALEDTLEAWQLSMSPEFRDLIQERIDELGIDINEIREENRNG